jgi:hypothetical protein
MNHVELIKIRQQARNFNYDKEQNREVFLKVSKSFFKLAQRFLCVK